MSFSFDFCVDEDHDAPAANASTNTGVIETKNACKFRAREISSASVVSLSILTQRAQLPDKLSYSPVVTHDGHVPVVLARRDLFDVRFQILNEDGTFADEQSDLIPGVYEGGLKTWECSLDLVSELHARVQSARQHDATWPSGRHIAEVCL